MKKRISDHDIIEKIEDAPEIRQIGEQIIKIKAALVATMTDQQRQLFSQYDDVCVMEGTARVNAALREVCCTG